MHLRQKIGQKTIGRTEYVEIAGIKSIPAKIDTGADSSSIWASNINIEKNGFLIFTLFGEESSLFTGEVIRTKDYTVKSIRSAHGDKQIRYCVKLPIVLHGESFDASFTLSNRIKHNYPVLIGRSTIEGKYIVDVSKHSVKLKIPKSKRPGLNKELRENPYEFHQKYLVKKGRA